MEFESFARLFGEKAQRVLLTPRADQVALMEIAARIHDAGFDWYLADNDVCFGVRPKGRLQALARAGRLWKDYTITVNSVRKRLASLPTAMRKKLESLALSTEVDGQRLRFSIQTFAQLVSDPAFLPHLARLTGVSGAPGAWPVEDVTLRSGRALTSIQEVFDGANVQLALILRVSRSRMNEAQVANFVRASQPPAREPDVLVLEVEGDAESEVWCGKYMRLERALDLADGFNLHVDALRFVGVRSRSAASDVEFYGDAEPDTVGFYVSNDRYEPSGDDPVPPDSDRRVLAKVREGQQRFKALLMTVWEGQCAVTGCTTRQALVGAHIEPYANGGSYAVSNGLLLRADIHSLYDAGLLSIDEGGLIHVSTAVADSAYRELNGRQVHLAVKKSLPEALCKSLANRHAQFMEGQPEDD